MNLIIGLGNPGKKYESTRHNIGFMVLDELARQHNLSWQEDTKNKALIAKGTDYVLVKPQTFMNLSGETTAKLLRYYHLLPRTIFGTKKDSDLTAVLTIIHDELDVPFGKYKVASNSSSAGHNGVQSIIDHLKTKNFQRIRIGINNESRKNIPGDKFVLQRFNDDEIKQIEKLLPEILSKIKL
ncbi:aminoacyl-tRNA hydrolase [Candidatus Falkowbacteria bacterium]|nr:MAG: aminoacyl-tRNA hydrolase [Candidatus Falkowbacteria bacterium]